MHNASLFAPLACVFLVLAGCPSDDTPPADGPGLGDAGDSLFWLPDGSKKDGQKKDGQKKDGSKKDGPKKDAGPPTRAQLAAHWAPVWYQDTDSSQYKADYITAYDFDGDHRSDNNWDNLTKSSADLSAVIYYSVVETKTHWYILYADFHARDWDENCQPIPFGPDKCHENDMEGAMVVVRKGTGPFGSFHLLYTEAHNILYIFTNDTSITANQSKNLKTVPVTFEKGTHPELYVEAKGHGVCALRFSGSKHCKHPTTGNPPAFPGGDGVVYRYKTGKAETPKSGKDNDVGYALVDLTTTLWTRRANICDNGCTFDGKMTYQGMTLGKAFDGDDHGDDKANPPWSWDDPDDGSVYRGDFFFRPAETVLVHVKVTGPFSAVYLHNPFLPKKP